MSTIIPHVREINPSRCTVSISWDDAPHLTEEAKDEMRRATPPHLLGARENGIPSLGAGVIFPIEPKELKVNPFPIPDYWPRLYALDVGWNKTAVIWLAWDRDNDVIYLYEEHYRGHSIPSTHAHAIKARGAWIPGVVDPAARGRSQRDGDRLFEEYRALGLDLVLAKNTVESGIYRTLELMTQGRLKVFSHLMHFFDELRIYRRDEDGKIIKKNDHLLDCCRYAVMGYEQHARVRPIEKEAHYHSFVPGVRSVGY